jgi:hypothetical protein
MVAAVKMRNVILCAVLLIACQKGVSKGARLTTERLQPHVAKLEGIAPSAVNVTATQEVFRNVWFARVTAKSDWRCFVDIQEIFCDHGDGKIFPALVSHRRLGDNRGSIDDAQWIEMVRLAYGLKYVYPDKDFVSSIDKSKLAYPRVERPKEGGVLITLYAQDEADKILRIEADVTGEGSAVVRLLPP